MQAPSLEEVIRSHVALPTSTNSGGFFAVLCKVCNDHGRKGKRAGFKFEGETVVYNCFNCGHAAVYDPHEDVRLSKNMVTVMDAFNIPKTDWQSVLLRGLRLTGDGTAQTREQFHSIEPSTIELPPFFRSMTTDPSDEWSQAAISYLTSRGIDHTKHTFYVVDRSDHPDNSKWYGRLIIPTYYHNKLVFWQGRDLTDLHVKKYLSARTPRDKILYGYHEIERNTMDPLYVMEGWFDAVMVNGVAVYGSKMTSDQIKWLNRTNRPKVIIPDRYGDGYLLGQQALDNGWAISTPDIGECKDVNEAVSKYGLLYTTMTLRQQTYDGLAGAAHLALYCDGPTNRSRDNKKTHPKPWI